MKSKSRTIFFSLIALTLLSHFMTYNNSVNAEILEGVSFDDEVTASGKDLVLNGIGIREATIFKVDVYLAGLYLEEKNDNAEQILTSDSVKLLRMKFIRDVGIEKIREAWSEGLSKNLSSVEGVRESLSKFNAMMEEMRVGDEMVLTFLPEEVLVKVKEKPIKTVGDAEFSRALLSVWLGKSPPNAGLKIGLLGKKS